MLVVDSSILHPYVMMSATSETESDERRNHNADEYSTGSDDDVKKPSLTSSFLGNDDKKPKAKSKPDLKKKKTKKPKDMPRRPLSAYNVFFRDERARILEERAIARSRNGGANAAATPSGANLFSALGKEVARRWKELDEEQLKKYNAAAEEEMARYRREMDEYHVGLARKRRLEENTTTQSSATGIPSTDSSSSLLGYNLGPKVNNTTLPLLQGAAAIGNKNSAEQIPRNIDLCNEIGGGLMGWDLSRLPTEILINQLRQQDTQMLLRNLNAPPPMNLGLSGSLGVLQQLQQHERNLNLERLLQLRTQMQQGNANTFLIRQLLQQQQQQQQRDQQTLLSSSLDDDSELRRLLQMHVPPPVQNQQQQQQQQRSMQGSGGESRSNLLQILSRQTSDNSNSNQNPHGGNELSHVLAMLRRQQQQQQQQENDATSRPDDNPSQRDSF